MKRLCLFGDGPAVPNGSRCRKHGGNPNQEVPNPYTRSYRVERMRILTPDARCYLCGGAPTPDDPLEADHVLPLSMGGGHRGNLRPAHRSCNRRKGGANKVRG
jgi:5-methylcytosine-specific restriction endonuclease McrA